MKNILLDDNENVHMRAFEVTFRKNDDDDDDETFFPDENDLESACDNSMLDMDNSYVIEEHKITNKKAVFIIYANNEKTDEYMPSSDDIEHALEDSGAIDEWNRFSVKEIMRTISKDIYRDNQLDKILI